MYRTKTKQSKNSRSMAAGAKNKETPPRKELPEELICKEILTRLPVQSLVRFKSVSKSWLSLFSNPQFVKDHYTRTVRENLNDCDGLITKRCREIFMLTRYKATSLSLPVLHSHDYKLIGSINGISAWLLYSKDVVMEPCYSSI